MYLELKPGQSAGDIEITYRSAGSEDISCTLSAAYLELLGRTDTGTIYAPEHLDTTMTLLVEINLPLVLLFVMSENREKVGLQDMLATALSEERPAGNTTASTAEKIEDFWYWGRLFRSVLSSNLPVVYESK